MATLGDYDAEKEVARREYSQRLYEMAKTVTNQYEWSDDPAVNNALITQLEGVVREYEDAHPYAEQTYNLRRAKEIMDVHTGRS